MIWFTADLHLGHRNVIRYSKRPFKDVEEMDEALVTNWNDVVRPGDSVYVVGDFSFHRREQSKQLFQRLAGQKFLVRGNHDKEDKVNALFGWVKDLYTVKVPDPDAPGGTQRIVLCHYALRVWDRAHYGTWSAFGHSHGTLPDDPRLRSTDVGVDPNGYFPVSYDQLKAKMREKTWTPVDHHGTHDEDA